MKHRVEIDVAFENESDAIALKEYIRSVRKKAYSPSGKEPIEVYRKCKKALDNFDETPASNITEVNFDEV